MRKNILLKLLNFCFLKEISRQTCGNEFAAKITEEARRKT